MCEQQIAFRANDVKKSSSLKTTKLDGKYYFFPVINEDKRRWLYFQGKPKKKKQMEEKKTLVW